MKKSRYNFGVLAKGKLKNKNYIYSGPYPLRIYRSEKIPGIGIDEELSNAIFTLKKNEVSKPIKSKTGYYIIKAISREDDRYADFDAVRDSIKNTIEKEKFIQAMDKEVAVLKKKYNVKIYSNLLE